MKRKKTFLKIFNNLWIKIFLPLVPSIWFTFFSVFGSKSEVFIIQNKLTPPAIALNIAMLTLIIFYSCTTLICQHLEKKQKIQEEKIYISILQNLDDANIFIRNKHVNALFDPSNSNCISDYQSNLNVLLMLLVKCLSETTQIDKSKFVASYFYKFESDKWRVINSDGKHKGLDVKILEDPSSVFSQLLSKDSSVFYSSKEEAEKESKYLSDKRDHEQKSIYNCPMGSIFGYNWSISDQTSNKIIFTSIITAGTYGEEVCSKKDSFTKKVIMEYILKTFENQFLLLAFDCIKHSNDLKLQNSAS